MNDADIRQLWTQVNQRMDAQERSLESDRNARLDRVADRSAWPAIAGQVGQIAVGLFAILLVAGLWSTLPTDPIVLLCGALLHIYGIAAISAAAQAIVKIRTIEFDRPLVESQHGLARAEKALVFSRIIAGQPWWFLWIAVGVVILGKAGVTFAGGGASVALSMLSVSVLGMILTLVVRAHLIRKGIIDDPVGKQLAGAQVRLDEIKNAFKA